METPENTANPQTIAQCERIIRPHIRRTPVIEVDGDDFGLPAATLTLKLELLQHSGSFKARGAFANLLTREVPKAGVVAASGGNQAAMAYAAMGLGKRAKSSFRGSPRRRRSQRIREYGADLAIEGDSYADALAASEAWAQQTGAMPIHGVRPERNHPGPRDARPRTRATSRRYRHRPGPRLAAAGDPGIAAWYAGRVKVVGVEPFASPTLTKALEAGHPVDAEAGGLAADLLAPRRIGEKVFPIVQKYARQTVLVSDNAIANAQAQLWRGLRIAAEPGGTAAFSAILSGAYKPAPGERVAVASAAAIPLRSTSTQHAHRLHDF